MQISVIGPRAFPADFPGTSGLEVYCQHVLTALRHHKNDANSIELTVYTRKKYQGFFNKKTHQNIRIIPLSTLNHKFLETLIYSLLASIVAALSSSNIVWYHGVGPAMFAFIPKLSGKKVVLTVHGLDWRRRKWSWLEHQVFYALSFLIFRLPHRVTVVSQKLQQETKNTYNRQSVLTLPGMIENLPLKFLHRKKRYQYFLFLGRVVPEKRLEWLMEAFLRLNQKKVKEFRLVIAGGHGNLPEYEKKLKSQYNHPHILWVGYVFGLKKYSLIRNSLCLVLPSELEGNPISVLEAISLGKNCIVADNAVGADLAAVPLIHTFPTDSFSKFEKLFRSAVLKAGKIKSKKLGVPLVIRKKYSWVDTATRYHAIFKTLSYD